MKRTHKWSFFVAFAIILVLCITTFTGVYTQYGDRTDTIIRGAADIRWGIDIRGGINVTYGPALDGKTATEAEMQSIQAVIEQRMMFNNITDYEIYTDLANQQVVVRFPWKSDETDFDPEKAIKELGQTAQLSFHIGSATDEETKKPTGDKVITGDDVQKATAMYQTDDNGSIQYVVQLELKESGKKKFADATKKQYDAKGTISIWLDDTMLSNPTVSAHITDGIATITGMSGLAEASELANLINSGALPFDIEVKSYGTDDPTMGTKALSVMVIAGLIAFVLIAIFLVVRYRLPGAVAVIALVGQITGSIMAVSGYFGVFESFTLTIPGIAGIILSIGMGVDANVITAERIKEELRAGKTIDGAIRSGSKESFWAIFDGNITVIIVAAVLMGVFGPSDSVFGWLLSPVMRWFPVATTGAVYSFGYTLLVGIVFNFIMGMTASRLMLSSLSRQKWLRKPWLYGGER